MKPSELVNFLVMNKYSFNDIINLDEWKFILEEKGDDQGLRFIEKIGEYVIVNDFQDRGDTTIIYFKEHNYFIEEISEYNERQGEYDSCKYSLVEVIGEKVIKEYGNRMSIGKWENEH
jgi:hypothetical protein